MEKDSLSEEGFLFGLLQQVVDACRVAGKPVPHVFAAYCLITLTQESDDGSKKFTIDEHPCGLAIHNKQQLPPEFAPAVQRALGGGTPAEQPLVACLRLQALYEAAVVRETDNYEKASGNGTAPAVADEVLSTPFTAVRNEKLLLEVYHNLNRFCYSQFRRESWSSSCGDEELLRQKFQAIFELVLPVTAVRSFVRFPRGGRLKYLQELYHIVLGGCIIRTQAGKKQQFPDPRKLLSKDVSGVIEKVGARIAEQERRSEALREFWMQREGGVSHADFCQDDIVLISREQLFLLQALDYSKTLKNALQHCFKTLRAAVVLCFAEIVNARGACSETAPSKEVAYPILAKVALRYRQAFSQRHRLDSLLRLADTLTVLLHSHTPGELVEQIIAKYAMKTSPEASNKQLTNNDTFLPADNDEPLTAGSVCSSATLKDPIPRKQETSYGLNAYCPWILIKSGALVSGDESHGVLKAEGCDYVFSSTRAREECESEGTTFLQSLRAQLLKTPPLIHFLKADRFFPRASLRRLLSAAESWTLVRSNSYSTGSSITADKRQTTSAPAATSSLLLQETYLVDKEVMTPTHFDTIERDNNYCWDEWTLRRQALQMASIMNRRTTNSQTHLSRCRTEQETQVYLLREQGQNTMKRTETSAIRRRRYVTNLRGSLKTEAFSANLQVDL